MTNINHHDALQQARTDPVFFAEVFLGWRAFPAQAKWLLGSTKPQNWCRAGNRWGKTESIAVKHLWHCTFKRCRRLRPLELPYHTVNTALSLDQATIPLTKAWRLVHRPEAEAYRKLFIGRMVQTPFPRIEFKHDATWWARSTARKGKYLEGKDYHYASNDEGALEPDLGYIVDEVLSLRLLDHGGQLDCISTGKRGSEFNRRFAMAQRDKNQFAFQGSTLDNPHLDKKALAALMSRLEAGLILERIHGGERPSGGRISYESIMRAIGQGMGSSDEEGAFPISNSWFHPPETGHRHTTGWDLAKSGDFTVGVTLDITRQPYQMVAWEKFNLETGTEAMDYWNYVDLRIRERHRQYGGLTQIDATGLGAPIADRLADINAEAVIFTAGRLVELIGCLELAFGLGLIGMPPLEMTLPNGRHWRFIDELEEVNDALTGLDTATALALALWGVRREFGGGLSVGLPLRVVGVKS